MLHTHYFNGTSSLSYYKQLFPEYDGSIILRLIQRDNSFPENQGEVIIKNCETGLSAFSLDSTMLAILVHLRDYTQEQVSHNDQAYNQNSLEFDSQSHDVIGSDRSDVLRKVHKVFIVQSESVDPNDILGKIKRKEFIASFDDTQASRDLTFVNSMSFDKTNQYLYGFGGSQFFIFDIQSEQWDIFAIDTLCYSKIFDIKILID